MGMLRKERMRVRERESEAWYIRFRLVEKRFDEGMLLMLPKTHCLMEFWFACW